MAATTVTRAPTTHPLLVIERILRDRESIWTQIANEHKLNTLIGQMFVSTVISLGFYGAVMGMSKNVLQALSSAVKLPILFLLTLAICLPTLYLFNLVFGSRLTLRQSITMVLVAITVTSMLTLAFAPISIFFLISAPDYDFFKLLNVVILALSGIIGLSFLVNGMGRINALSNTPPEDAEGALATNDTREQPVNMKLLYVWIVLYGFVGTQLGWTLRPFFGDPGADFQIIRQIEGNFYVNIVQALIGLFRYRS
jgi:hypothetical protein